MLSLVREPKGIEKKKFKRVWQVVQTIFFASKNTFFFLNLRKLRIFHFFPDFAGSSRRKLYEK